MSNRIKFISEEKDQKCRTIFGDLEEARAFAKDHFGTGR
jgi:hypothetical protein